MPERDERLCKYNGGSCANPRATRGRAVLRVCEFHRRKANAHQKTYQQRRKKLLQAATVTNHVTSARAVPQPFPPVHGSAPHAAAVPPPLVVFVLANEKDVDDSLRRLSSGEVVRVGQPFQVVSRDRLGGFLNRINPGELLWQEDVRGALVKSERPVPKAGQALPPGQVLDDLEPLPLELAGDGDYQLLPEDVSWLHDIFT